MRRINSLLWLFLSLIPPTVKSIKAENYALLVGINDYQHDIGSLKYCIADVVAFRKALIETASFKAEHVHLMTDRMSGQDLPTRINVIMRLDILASQVQAEDTFIFYFSGHGISTNDQPFLLATDSNATTSTTLELSAIPLEKVNKILSKIKAQQLLTIIDACRNDPSSGRGNQDNLLSDNFARGFKVRRQAGTLGKPAVSATLYACSVGERAYEWSEKKQGVFSYYLIQGLNGDAANAEGEVTITGLAGYTQRKVMDWAQTYRGKKQTPWLSLQGGAKLVLSNNVSQVIQSSMVFTNTTKVTTNIADPETEMWELVKDSTKPEEIEGFLALFPNGKLVGVAKLKLKQLMTPALASSQIKIDEKSIILAAQLDAQNNVNGSMWMCGGCATGPLGIAWAYLVEPSPPSGILVGKSPEYARIYTASYKSEAKRIQKSKSLYGCIGTGLVYAAFYVLGLAAIASDTAY